VPTVTEGQRLQRIKELLAELNKIPPEKHEVIRVPGPGNEPRHCQVIKIHVDEVVLNPRSHRVRAQLEDDPEWAEHKDDPFSETAQAVIQRQVRAARSREAFAALKESLANEGQTDPGVITSKGVLINANTRAVALRELDDPNKRYIRVAVLPETMQEDELALLELRLQMQKELKVEYSLTNELLFIEELSVERSMPPAQIAKELRIGETAKKGETEVSLRLKLLDLLRTMQQLPKDGLRLTDFDSLGYEQLRDLHRAYSAVVDNDPVRATGILEAFLLSVSVGVTPVHQLRRIDPDFIPEYMLPQLEEDEMIGAHAAKLAALPTAQRAKPTGVGALLTGSDGDGDLTEVNVRGLIDIVTQRDHKVPVPGTNFVLERDDVKDAVKTAIINGVTEKRRDDTASDRLQAPIDRVRSAAKQVDKCREACDGVIDTAEFGDSLRKSLEVAFKRLQKNFRLLEAELAKAGVIKR
jgi:hypothetical protein